MKNGSLTVVPDLPGGPLLPGELPLLGTAFCGWVHNGDSAALEALFDQLMQFGNDSTYAALLAEVCHGRALAVGLGPVEGGHLGHRGPGSVHHLGQHLVQRALPDLGRRGRHPG